MLNQLNRIQTFMAVVDCGSFTRAAQQLYLSKSMVSTHVKNLEAALQLPLLTRSHKGVILTEAGEALYKDFQVILADIEGSLTRVAAQHKTLSGHLRVSTTHDFAHYYLLDLIGRFCQNYPEIELSLMTDSALNDLITDRLDLAIRLGTLTDSSLKSRCLGRYDIYLVSSPEYLRQHPIHCIADLNQASWINNTNIATSPQWLFTQADKSFQVRTTARYFANSSTSIKALLLSDLGIAVLPEWMIRTELKTRQLIRICPDYALPQQEVHVVYAGDRRMQSKSRVFIDYLLQNFTF